MSWVTPPSFTTSEVLTAAKMQQIADGIAFLNGLSAAPNPPFSIQTVTNNVAATFYYYDRYKSRYWHFVTYTDGANRMIITVNGTQRHTTAPANGLVDTVLDSSGWGLTLGAFVQVSFEMRSDSGKSMSLYYATQLDSNASIV